MDHACIPFACPHCIIDIFMARQDERAFNQEGFANLYRSDGFTPVGYSVHHDRRI